MIRLRGHMICVSDAEVAALTQHLEAHVAQTRAEPGCIAFEITATDDPMVFEVMEAFRSMADFNAHQARMRASDWFAATRAITRNFRMEEIGD